MEGWKLVGTVWTVFLLLSLAASVAAWAVLLLHEKGFSPISLIVRDLRRQPMLARLILGILFVGCWVYGSVKNSGGVLSGGVESGGVGELDSNHGMHGIDGTGTNHVFGRVESVEDVDNVANVELLPVANSNTQLGNGEWGTGNGSDLNNSHLSSPISHYSSSITHLSSLITEGDCKAGFVLSGIGTNELHDFSPNEGAVVNEDWRKFGAGRDWFYLALDSWRFPVGTNEAERLRIFSNGEVNPLPGLTNSLFAPFLSDLHVLPEERWEPCRFWHSSTPSNTVVLTWQNVFLNRSTNSPASFQMEMWPNGNFVYRYDLSRTGLWDGNAPSNITVGAMHDGISRTVDVYSMTNLTSLHFHRLDPADLPGSDRDGDGLTVEDEIFVHRTDPGLWDTDLDGISDGEEAAMGCNPKSRDTDGDAFCDGTDPHPAEIDPWDDGDGDSLPDSWKVHWFGSNAVSAAGDENQDGISNLAALMMGISPVKQCDGWFAVDNQGSVPEINAWEIAPSSFSFQRPPMLTNLIVRTFTIARQSPWEQFFISSRPDCAAGWSMEGVELSYGIDGEPPAQSVPPCISDSWRLDFGEGMPHTVTVRLAATGPLLSLSAPLYLLRWSPRVEFRPSALVHTVASTNGHIYAAAKRESSTGLYSIPFSVDVSRYPHRGGMEASAALDLALPPAGGISVTNIPHLAFTSEDPVLVDLPREGTNLSKRILCYSVSFENATAVEPGPRASKYESPYPLDRTSLRVAYHKASDKESKSSVALVLKPSVPELSFRKAATKTVRSMPLARTGGDDDGHEFFPPFSGWPEVGGDPCTNDTYDVDFEYPENHDSTYPEEDEEDEDDDCECGCDGDSSLGSFRLRIPLGESAHDELSGFLWTHIDAPVTVSPRMFHVLSAPGISVTTNSDSSIRVSNTRLGGKSLAVTNIAYGVAIPVWGTDGKLEARWEVVNDPWNLSRIRVRKFTRLENVTEDETYEMWHEDYPAVFGEVWEESYAVVWEKTDNLRGLVHRRYEWHDENEPRFVERRYDETWLDGNPIRAELKSYVKVGLGESACRRVGSVYGYDEYGWHEKECTYWCDTDSKGRHGRLRSIRSGREPWRYHDYDSFGRETVRIEQLDGSAFAELEDISLDAPLDEYTSVKVTLTDYAPQDGDSAHRNDSCKPRSIKAYVRKNGESPILVSQETYVYERDVDSDGIAVCRQIRTSGFGDAVRTVASVSYAEDSSVPKYLRGLPVSVVDDAGVLTETAYSLSNGCLIATSRLLFNGREKDAFTKTTTDAAYRLPLKEETCLSGNGVCIGWTSRSYDSQRRLRSVRYSDGTCETNAYSCCRLLWRQDREGRKTLRSAKTGNDHLYYAEEEVWLAELGNGERESGNGFRVTQHFFDGLGRETNRVVCVGLEPGEAVEPDFVSRRAEETQGWDDNRVDCVEIKTEYPYGESHYSAATDERGKVTVRSIGRHQSQEQEVVSILTNGIETVRTITTTWRNGPTTVRREWDGGKWSEECRKTDYALNGNRMEYVIVDSYDYGIVTNSISEYDVLGRLISSTIPGATSDPIVNCRTYDGMTSRILKQSYAAGDVLQEMDYVYSESGDQVGSVLAGVTNRTDVTYDFHSNEWWRVETSVIEGTATNSFTVERSRLTGLSDACRSHVVKLNGTYDRSVPPALTGETLVSFDPATGMGTEVDTSPVASGVVRRSCHGVLLSTEADGETVFNSYDALGRISCTSRLSGGEGLQMLQSFDYAASGDLVSASTYTNADSVITEIYAYDMLGNRIATTDALGNTVSKTYDPFGNIIAEWGAAYPVRYAYDSQNRRISQSTTRDGGTWDETLWEYDAATGLCLAKTYADGSAVTYSYTADNLPLRTSYAGGGWLENVYDERRRHVGTISSDGDDCTAFVLDEFGRETQVSNCNAAISLAFASAVSPTNEDWNVGGSVLSFSRSLDGFGRLSFNNGMHHSYSEDGRLSRLSNALVRVDYLYSPTGMDAGYSILLSNGMVFSRTLERDGCRRNLVTNILSAVNGIPLENVDYRHDALGRPMARNADSFTYNGRGEVTEALVLGSIETHAYDGIGNHVCSASGAVTNLFVANVLNQYASILNSSMPQCEVMLQYDLDGNMLFDGVSRHSYDSFSRLKSVSRNGNVVLSNHYDAKSRRVRKITPAAVTTFFYDGWNLIEERVAGTNGTVSTFRYYWGKDVSGELQGAGGVGGLLYLTFDDEIYIPLYDGGGNVTKYIDASGNIVASYTYGAFGQLLSKSGPLADVFRFRFSTKYYDAETGLYYYGYRFYSTALMRWLNRDPIEEKGGLNLYSLCLNNVLSSIDPLGLDRYMTTFSFDMNKDQWHVGVAVDTWECQNGIWQKTGIITFDYLVDDSAWWKRAGRFVAVAKGVIQERAGLNLIEPFMLSSSPEQDVAMLEQMRKDKSNPPLYNFVFNNCIHWATKAIDYGMDK